MPDSVIVFPGQGSQHSGMIAAVPESDDLPRLIDAAEACSGLDLRAIERSGTAAQLADTRVAQPLLYLTGWGWGRALIDVGVNPVVVAGHSLGELTALAIAEVFSVEAGLELVCARSQMMAEATESSPGTMAAVLGLGAQQAEHVIENLDGVWVANDNSAVQVVVSGTADAIEAARVLLEQAGARKIVPLPVAGAFHSPLMKGAAARFASLLEATEFNDARIPVVQNTRPRPSTDAAEIRAALIEQMDHGVRWTETMQYVSSIAPVFLIEAGPGTVLKGLARGVGGVTPVTLEDEDLETVLEEVVG